MSLGPATADAARPTVAVIGAGPAGLMAAEAAAARGACVTVFERMPSPARKFLLAGRGGLNLTHGEPSSAFRSRYRAAADALGPALDAFDATALRGWCAALGVATIVGTSGRVFPVGWKTSPLLRAWLRRLDTDGVSFRFRHQWRGWSGDALAFDTPDGETTHVAANATVLALGGASWPQLGSDGSWVPRVEALGVAVAPLEPSNCGFRVAWSAHMSERFAGQALKSIALAFGNEMARGDLVVTRDGLEGGPLYALSGPLRRAAAEAGFAQVMLSLRPDLRHDQIVARLARRDRRQSFSTAMRKALALAPIAVAMLRESDPGGIAGLPAEALARRINAVPLRLEGPSAIARAISTAGGIPFEALDQHLMLNAKPGLFVAGEMLDWEAPTGGYLLQASFATGRLAGRAAAVFAGGDQGNIGSNDPPTIAP